MDSPVVSVVIGVYNGASSLPATLQSALEQDGVAIEVVVVDDGSTDETWQVLESVAASEPRLRPHRQSRGGLTKALVTGCALARGEFIARQDVGDITLPTRLQKQAEWLASQPDFTFVACQWITVGPDGEELAGPAPSDGGKAIVESLQEAPLSAMECPHHGSVMFRRSAYEQVGGYRPEFYFAQDLDLWSRLIELGKLGFVQEVLYRSSFSPGCLSARYRKQQLLLRELIREAALCRRRGESDSPVLQEAALIRPGSAESSRRADAAAAYFIGSCLLHRGDRDAAKYLRRAVAGNPMHVKAWLKLLGSQLI